MDPSQSAAAVEAPQEIVAKIDQKAMRLSALLRDIDNHPIELSAELVERLDEILEMIERYKVLSFANERAANLLGQALATLRTVRWPGDREAVSRLEEIARYSVERDW